MFDDGLFEDKPFENVEDNRADRALYAGLRDLPTPDTAADFEARILDALAPRPPFWQTAWRSILRPALPTALCTLTGMLLLLREVQRPPMDVRSLQSAVIARDAARRLPQEAMRGGASQEASHEGMDSIDLNSTALSFLSRPIRRFPAKRG